MKKLWKIGELAKAAGVTVRTLHHYDRIGLLVPSGPKDSKHRIYTRFDLDRLQQVVCLRSMGLSLEEIDHLLNAGSGNDLQNILTIHAEAIIARIDELKKALDMLFLMQSQLEKNMNIDSSELLSFIRKIKQMESLYTEEQLKKLQERLERYPAEVKIVEEAWPKLFGEFEKAMKSHLDPSCEEVQALARQAQSFIDLFTGNDKEIEATFDKSYVYNQQIAQKSWGVSQEVFRYADNARQIFKKISNAPK